MTTVDKDGAVRCAECGRALGALLDGRYYVGPDWYLEDANVRRRLMRNWPRVEAGRDARRHGIKVPGYEGPTEIPLPATQVCGCGRDVRVDSLDTA